MKKSQLYLILTHIWSAAAMVNLAAGIPAIVFAFIGIYYLTIEHKAQK